MQMQTLDFQKGDGLIPVIVQHAFTEQVLMLGFMNEQAYQKTVQEKKVTFFSRTRNALWTKGETSGHFLHVVGILTDCDNDTLLIKALPEGPTCHRGTTSCFDSHEPYAKGFLYQLEAIIQQRLQNPTADSYTVKLAQKGIPKMAQKVGEEAVELVIEAMQNDKERFLNEAADLLFHFLLLLKSKQVQLQDVEQVLKERHWMKTTN